MPLQPIASRMAIKGHPLHPVLIHFPVAALLGLLATDLAFWWTDDPFWARASLWLAGVGAAGGWLSGLAGLVDLVTVRRIRRLVAAWSHGVLAILLLSVASLNWLLRWDDPVNGIFPWGLTLSLVTAGLIGIVGYLGGQLVYEYGVGVDIDEALNRKVRP